MVLSFRVYSILHAHGAAGYKRSACALLALALALALAWWWPSEAPPYLKLGDPTRHAAAGRPHAPHAARPCRRIRLSELASADWSQPLVFAGAEPALVDSAWADPVRSPLARFGEHQIVQAFFAPDYDTKVAGRSLLGGRAAMRLPSMSWLSLSRAIHLATRREGEHEAGCCLKLQNIPFVEGDDLLPEALRRLVVAGRDLNALREDEDNWFVPQIWAHQSGVVIHLHYDEFDAVILQGAGTRVATLFAPSRRSQLLVESNLPVELLVEVKADGAARVAAPPNATLFPPAYQLQRCGDHNATCTREIANGSTLAIEPLDIDTIFSPLDLASRNAPRADFTCAIRPGDALYIPRHWFHRLDDDPEDAATDLFQVSFSFWFLQDQSA